MTSLGWNLNTYVGVRVQVAKKDFESAKAVVADEGADE